jgi:quinolinate synthase
MPVSTIPLALSTFDIAPYQSMTPDALTARIQKIRQQMGSRLLILGHHYQQDEVLALSDLRGDSYQLAALASSHDDCRAIAFCGVHFMAETADILANRLERLEARGGDRVEVILPDLAAGCSLADMADIDQVEECWEQLAEVIDVEDLLPITYVNSAANLKAFCGRHGGIVCTSANARAALDWAFARRSRVLFFPDQHLGRNTAKTMGIPLDQMPLWNPAEAELGGNSREAIERSRVLLWRGHCSVHEIFRPQHIAMFRQKYPGIRVIVHPECSMDVVDAADDFGSTGKIIKAVKEAPPGTIWAIGTELHLVNRLKQEHPEQQIHFLSPVSCMCSTMYRIDLPHLAWSLENLAAGSPVNIIRVDPETARWALIALQRMLEVR